MKKLLIREIREIREIRAIFRLFAEKNPHPEGELLYKTKFELLIAVVLSAQATDTSVNKVTRKLFSNANTPATVLALGVDGLKSYIRTIGLFNNKAKHIIALCKRLIEKYDSTVPNDLLSLQSLPGVGRKTANVVLNIAFSQPTIAVDTHVFRVSRRLGLTDAKTVLAVEQDLLQCIPSVYLRQAHHWLILHGRYVCKARSPCCQNCFLTQYCQSYENFS